MRTPPPLAAPPAMTLIPSAPFLMGTPERELSGLAKRYGGTRESYREESPQHALTIPAFAIATAPLTVGEYAAFVAAAGAPPPAAWRGTAPPPELHAHPATDLSWVDALAYCAWRTAAEAEAGGGWVYRLPTEAEWECAARGADGRQFPWGEAWQDGLANTRESELGRTVPVGSYPGGAGPHGLLDSAGTVWEWTLSLDRPYPYDPADGREDRGAAGRRIIRGGCYANPQGYARCACRFRMPPTMRNEFLGFRLAADLRGP